MIQIQQKIISTKEGLENHLRHSKCVAEEVKTQGKKLKEDIDVLIDLTLSELKLLEDENTQLLTSYKTELECKHTEVKDRLNQSKETLQTGTDIQVFWATSRLHTMITLPTRPLLGTAKFSPNEKSTETLISALGKMTLTSSGQSAGCVFAEEDSSQLTSSSGHILFENTHSQLASPLPKIVVLSEWDSPCDIRFIVANGNIGAWAYSFHEKKLMLLTNDGRAKQQIKSLHTNAVTNISVSPSTQKVWACSGVDNSVMELKSSTWLTSSTLILKFHTKDEPKCLCVTQDGHVLVGTTHGITKYTQGGKPSMMTTSQSHGQLVRSPKSISECPVSENVAVLDRDTMSNDDRKEKPLIIVMDKNIQELYRYGHHQHTRRTGAKTFDPWDIAYDSRGQLVVTDCINNCLHLLSGNGHYIGQLYTDIDRPLGVCVDRQGVLWVAFGGMFIADKVKRLQYASD